MLLLAGVSAEGVLLTLVNPPQWQAGSMVNQMVISDSSGRGDEPRSTLSRIGKHIPLETYTARPRGDVCNGTYLVTYLVIKSGPARAGMVRYRRGLLQRPAFFKWAVIPAALQLLLQSLVAMSVAAARRTITL
jgi:hypothetical protein